VIDEKYGLKIWHLSVLNHRHAAVVQHEPISIKPSRYDGVVFSPEDVPQDHDSKVIGGNPSLLQRKKLCDSVIFAVAGTYAKRGQGRAPDIFLTPLTRD